MIHAIALVTTVHIRNFAFSPAHLRIATGQSVRFVNDDQDAHTVTADSRAFSSDGLDTGDAWTHVFTRPGEYTYFCALHPYMRGSIIVVPRVKR
ncbi:MAG TPA: cupredoxin domain-containing protein [Verrucomicrobiae bacterium]|jgi:plastocyanin|nr:cupredoxin domain-containing protein [Verrucomicrobiae bacterium]